jgi:TRAP-type mannitol/chloroaromatic compound transport system permease small subunit
VLLDEYGSMKRFLDLIDKINDQGGKIISFLVIFMIGAMTYEVIARYVFNSPTIWSRETVQFLLGGYAILGGAYVLRHQGHVNMDILYGRLPPRWRAVADVVTAGFFFLFCGVLMWFGAKYAWKSWGVGETTGSTWAPPEYFIKTAIPVGAFLIIIQGLAKFIRDFMTAIRGVEDE